MLNPECMQEFPKQTIAYTADGFLLPCCWCDSLYTRSDIKKLGLFDDNLKLKNVDSVNDIVNSNVWKNFSNILLHKHEDAPSCCKKKCGVASD